MKRLGSKTDFLPLLISWHQEYLSFALFRVQTFQNELGPRREFFGLFPFFFHDRDLCRRVLRIGRDVLRLMPMTQMASEGISECWKPKKQRFKKLTGKEQYR